jgi:asparagine synthase (glutamine-hydrolysing)
MCGIVGLVEPGDRLVDGALVATMSAALRHRGPDDDGFYVNGPVGLGMRRLSIIDVQGGRQPVHNEDKSVWAVFNGEIYNYAELRRELEGRGHHFYTRSDTETLVHLYEEWGDDGLTRLRGMFGFALWDERRRRLLLARDRLGIKPLYYALVDGRLAFASELKALVRVPWVRRQLDPAGVQRYLTYLYIPGPGTIYRSVFEIPPAHYLVYQAGRVSVRRYWTIRYAGHGGSAAEWEERFLDQFRDSVRSHLVSEVPLGAFLSGGVDSSAIVAAMAEASSAPVKTFSIGYEGKGAFQDERRYARIVAERFATDHHEFVVTADVQRLLPEIVTAFDQPFADSSAIPNYHISQMTRRHVTVALSGLGGDEIGGGYERYLGMLWSRWYRQLPRPIRQALLGGWVSRLPDVGSGRRWIDRLKRFASAAELETAGRYAALVSAFGPEERERLLTADFRASAGAEVPEGLLEEVFRSPDADGLVHYLMLADLRLYLPGDLLALTDRTSMLHSLEVRVPFLDHPLVELMASVPAGHKVSGWSKKILMKRAFRRLLPREILTRKKVGFSVPLALWLRTDLAPAMREILSEGEIQRIGYLCWPEVRRMIREHLDRRANHESKLWALINLVCWHRLNRLD